MNSLDWTNIDLSDTWEADLNLIENLTFSALLLEIECNLREINAETVRKQFEQDLRGRIHEAREIFAANLAGIVKHAQEYRER